MITNVETCEQNIRIFDGWFAVFSERKTIYKVYTNNEKELLLGYESVLMIVLFLIYWHFI